MKIITIVEDNFVREAILLMKEYIMYIKEKIKLLFFLLSKKVHKKQRCSKRKKILVVSLTHLGDTVLLESFFYYLSEFLPNSNIDVLTKKGIEDIFYSFRHPPKKIFSVNAFWLTKGVNRFQSIIKIFFLIKKIRRLNYDMIIVTHPQVFTSFIVYCMHSKCLVGYAEKSDMYLNDIVPQKLFNTFVLQRNMNLLNYIFKKKLTFKKPIFKKTYNVFLKNLITYNEKKYYIAIHSGAGGKQKIWNSLNFAKVINLISKKIPNCCFVLLGYGDDKRYIDDILSNIVNSVDIINLYNMLDLKQLSNIFYFIDYMLTNDSGLMHIAYATDTPGVALFGPSDYKIWAPRSKKWRILYNIEDINLIKPEKVLEWILHDYTNI